MSFRVLVLVGHSTKSSLVILLDGRPDHHSAVDLLSTRVSRIQTKIDEYCTVVLEYSSIVLEYSSTWIVWVIESSQSEPSAESQRARHAAQIVKVSPLELE
jgi:hypothetical protein